MKSVRDRADSRLLPSRFHFALFQLGALVRMRGTAPQPSPGLLLSIDRDQSAGEHYTVACWILLTTASFCHAALDRVIVSPAALALALPAACTLLMAALFLSAGLAHMWKRLTHSSEPSRVPFNSVFMMGLVAAAAFAHLQSEAGMARLAARLFAVCAVANLVAAGLMLILRPQVREMERRCGL